MTNSDSLSIIVRILARHDAILDVLIDAVEDVVLIMSETLVRCDCCNNHAATMRVGDKLSCDRCLALRITKNPQFEEAWDEITNAESVRFMTDYVNARKELERALTVH